LQRGLKNRSVPKGKSKVNLKNARSIGILFDATSIDERNRLLKYAEQLKKQGKKVHLLAYVDELMELESLSFPAYNTKGLRWDGIPKAENVLEFIDQSFDLLFHISSTTSPHEAYITALSKAQLRVGPHTDCTDCYDLMIGLSAKAGMDQFIRQMELLLGKTNIRNEAA
jgi:hypothetical protein